MSWWGKAVCAGIGAALGGPVGAGIGVAAGHFIFSSAGKGKELSDQEKLQEAFFYCMFSAFAKVVEADGLIDKSEIAEVENLISNTLEIGDEAQQAAIEIFKGAINDGKNISDYLNPFATLTEDNDELRFSFYNSLFKIALADGKIGDSEELVLREAAVCLHFNHELYDTLYTSYLSDVFSECVFSALAKIAKADGKVDKSEIEVIEEFIRYLELDDEKRGSAIKIFQEAKSNSRDISEYLVSFAELVTSEELRQMLYSALFHVAIADGKLHSAEESMIKNAVTYLRLRPGFFEESRKSYFADIEKPYAVLGCHSGMSDQEIKVTYRQRCKEFHSDTLCSKGLPSEFIKFADQKLAEFNQAYEAIMETRKCA